MYVCTRDGNCYVLVRFELIAAGPRSGHTCVASIPAPITGRETGWACRKPCACALRARRDASARVGAEELVDALTVVWCVGWLDNCGSCGGLATVAVRHGDGVNTGS